MRILRELLTRDRTGFRHRSRAAFAQNGKEEGLTPKDGDGRSAVRELLKRMVILEKKEICQKLRQRAKTNDKLQKLKQNTSPKWEPSGQRICLRTKAFMSAIGFVIKKEDPLPVCTFMQNHPSTLLPVGPVERFMGTDAVGKKTSRQPTGTVENHDTRRSSSSSSTTMMNNSGPPPIVVCHLSLLIYSLYHLGDNNNNEQLHQNDQGE